MKDVLKKALAAMINKKSIVGLVLGALIALVAQLSGLSIGEVKDAACPSVEAPVVAPAPVVK